MLRRRYPPGLPLGPELLGYNFTMIHRPARMMQDADALSQFYGPLISAHFTTAHSLQTMDSANRPYAYTPNAFPCHTTRCPGHPPKESPPADPTPPWESCTLVNIPTRLPYFKAHHRNGPVNTDTWSSTSTFATARHCHWYSIHPGLATIPAALAMHSTLGTLVFSAIHADLPHANICHTHFAFDHSHLALLADLRAICSTLANQKPGPAAHNKTAVRSSARLQHRPSLTPRHATGNPSRSHPGNC